MAQKAGPAEQHERQQEVACADCPTIVSSELKLKRFKMFSRSRKVYKDQRNNRKQRAQITPQSLHLPRAIIKVDRAHVQMFRLLCKCSSYCANVQAPVQIFNIGVQ